MPRARPADPCFGIGLAESKSRGQTESGRRGGPEKGETRAGAPKAKTADDEDDAGTSTASSPT